MTIKRNIGGDRLGSGSKMEVQMHDYERSTHDLSRVWRSSATVGTLIPFLTEIGLNGDKFEIDLNAAVKTIPTVAPLFGSFKLQLDVFEVPMRLYNGLLHNNALRVGMNMAQAKIPQIKISLRQNQATDKPIDIRQFAPDCLMTYLGVRGLGICRDAGADEIKREFNAIPVLAYYDIFKNYYANKMENGAYVIGADVDNDRTIPIALQYWWDNDDYIMNEYDTSKQWTIKGRISSGEQSTLVQLVGENLVKENIYIDGERIITHPDISNVHYSTVFMGQHNGKKCVEFRYYNDNDWIVGANTVINVDTMSESGKIKLVNFPLENIDNMRIDIMKASGLNQAIKIDSQEGYLPYSQNCETTASGNSYNMFNMNGLCIKTYQSDIFNNWIQTDWIDGENGITAVTAVSTAGDEFTLDSLNLAQKVYDMLNRIALSGGSYEDWQEVTYGQNAIRRTESPVFMGGMSSEIVFEEVVSTAKVDEANPLGSLAGKGRLTGQKGGKIEIKCTEPSIIMGIMSITPRLDYAQGNKWYMNLKTIDDLHKPALDGIGFQELITEQMAWWDTNIQKDTNKLTFSSAGKQPAWLNYMTAYNEVYGDFADDLKAGYMVLKRNYEPKIDTKISDVTTYIDPTKFNYAFADKNLDAQNFWVQIASKIEARRVMSAKIIPNL